MFKRGKDTKTSKEGRARECPRWIVGMSLIMVGAISIREGMVLVVLGNRSNLRSNVKCQNLRSV
jgi:hypothetical protein